ncbi:MAG: BatA domain-containing protein [Chitinophagales bacterium]|nr:BatA domain-containing protein [Chitinophagales bacterium]
MSFLYPSFLFALTAVTIPIIIHLFNFRRYKTVYFSNVRFLREVKEKTDSRSQLKHLLILLARILAICFLVFAFAQPYLKGKTAVTVGKKAVSIFIDNSFSMGLLGMDVPLLEQAKLKATQLVDAFGADDLFQLLTEDFEGRHMRLVDKEEMLNLIKEVQPSSRTQSVADIISRQKQALNNSGGTQKIMFLLSDFQKNFSDFTVVKPDSAYAINLVPLRGQGAANLFIDSCWMESPVQVAGQSNKLFISISNSGDQPVENGRMTLKINDETKAISDFTIPDKGAAIDTISFTISESGWNRAELSLIDNPITFDDTYFFAYPIAKNINVMIINENISNPYLNALFAKNDFFIFRESLWNQLDYSDLSKQHFVILNGLQQMPSGLGAEIKKFIEKGGNVLIFPNSSADISSYNTFLQSINADLLIEFRPQKKSVSSINTLDKVFTDVFQQAPQNLSMPGSSGNFLFSKRTTTNASALMKYSNGDYFMVKYNYGSGIFYLSAVPLDKDYTDLPVNAVFAPLIYKMAISKESSSSISFTIGKNNLIKIQTDLSKDDQLLRIQGHNQEFIPSQRPIGNEIQLSLNNEINQSGIYALSDPNNEVKSYVAMNYNRKESDLQFLSNDELKKAVSPLKIKVIENANRDLGEIAAGQHLGLPLWKVSVIFVLLFITLEIVLLKFWK